MDRSTPIILVSETHVQNALGEWISSETKKTVYANVKSVTANEFFNAGQIGLAPEYKFTMFGPDYSGEKIVEYNGYRYTVYRTYQATTDLLELYVELRIGHES